MNTSESGKLKKKNIVFLEHCIDNTVGGSHYCLLEICRSLDKRLYNSTVVFYQNNDLIKEFQATCHKVRIEKPHRPVVFSEKIPKRIQRVIRVPINLLNMLFFRVRAWRKLLREESADILHLNNTFSYNYDAILAAKTLGIPIVSHVRGIEEKISKVNVVFSYIVDKIIVISNAVKDNLLKHGISENKMRFVNDGINQSRIIENVKDRFLFSEYGLKDDYKIIGLIGNIRPLKGQMVLVKALSLLKKRYDKFYCFLVGAIGSEIDKKYYNEIDEYLKENDLVDQVILTGYQKNIPDILNSFDILVQASIEPESFGIVILEAFSLKKPVIATNIGAPQEIIEDGKSGILFNAADPEDLANKLYELMQNEELRKTMGAEGYQRFRNNFTMDKIISGISQVYEEVFKQ